MIKGWIQEEDIRIINIYAPHIGALQYVRQMLTSMKREINSNTIIVGDFNTLLTPMDQFSSVQSLSRVQLFVIPWITACQASLSITNSQSSLRLMSIKSVIPSSHLILCRPLLLPPSIFSRIRVFSNKSVLCIKWPNYWSFSFSISPSTEYPGMISFRMDWLDLLVPW